MTEKKAHPKVTVLLPVFNGEAFILPAIESILSQTFSDFEFLIIDDGSTDDSYELTKRFKDSRIRVIRKENEGLGKTLNRGLTLAKGEYVARLDVDDLSDSRRLEKQVAYLDAHPDVAVIGTLLKVVYDDGTTAVRKKPVSHAECMRHIIKSNPLAHPSVMFRKRVVRELGGYSLEFDGSRGKRYGMDYHLWVRVAAAGHKIGNLPDPLLTHRKHSHSISGSKRFWFMMKERVRIRLWAKETLGLGHKAYVDMIGVAVVTIYQRITNNKLDFIFNKIG